MTDSTCHCNWNFLLYCFILLLSLYRGYFKIVSALFFSLFFCAHFLDGLCHDSSYSSRCLRFYLRVCFYLACKCNLFDNLKNSYTAYSSLYYLIFFLSQIKLLCNQIFIAYKFFEYLEFFL